MGSVLSLCAAQSEFHDCPFSPCRIGHSHGLGGNESLEVERIEDEGFNQLGIHKGGLDSHKRFSRKSGCAFVKGIDVS